MSDVEIPSVDLVLSEDEARELTGRIRQTGSVLWSQIVKAFQGRAWAVMGYDSWDEYCDTEFDGARLKLPREERTMVVASLADAGMSNKSIAAAIGVTPMTVGRDRAGVTKVTPASATEDEIVDAEVIDAPEPEPRKVTGTDGKSYTVTPKPAPRRPSIAPDIDQAAASLHRAVERIERLTDDDRFTGAVTPYLASVAQHAIDVLSGISTTNNTGEHQ